MFSGLPEVYGNDGLKVQSPIVKNILTPMPFPPVEQGAIELSQNPAVSDDSLDVSAMLNEFLETSAPVAAVSFSFTFFLCYNQQLLMRVAVT